MDLLALVQKSPEVLRGFGDLRAQNLLSSRVVNFLSSKTIRRQEASIGIVTAGKHTGTVPGEVLKL